MDKKIAISTENKKYAFVELDYTHDHSSVKVGSIMIDIYGGSHKVTKIDKDDCGRRQFWSGKTCLTIQYDEHHNMRTKRPFYAHEFKLKK